MASKLYPTEDQEAMAFADWLRAKRYPHTHIANELGGATRSIKTRAIKAHAMGQTAGVWDYEVFVPIYGISEEIDAYQELRIELKRQKGGVVSEPQKKWGRIYELAGIPCKVCKGCAEAIEFVRQYENQEEDF